ncbi:MFS transporter [Frigidibacter sp. ROC022]|uniref:MFS transporter n=1 Tax=Frigidibacter sp. ROC022 TaxID=2971796 RepID=UPI00215A5E92|nr:MFS transporter [Frigidibacter sp. ROC022]MCR8724304.1 MFS transporter [Frigidibacter sp. ROC022]
MFNRRTPLLLKHGNTPGARHFALLAGLDAAVRGMLVSVMPLTVYRAMGSADGSSHVYLAVGLVALVWGLMVPWATSRIPRRWMYTLGCCSYLIGMVLALIGGPLAVALALGFNSLATVTLFVCLNAYVLDYVARNDLGQAESLKMFFAAAPWAIGPVAGVWLLNWWAPAPFLASGLAASVMLMVFWALRLGNGKAIARARGPAVNPLAYLRRFFAQPRLIAGWVFAVTRSCGWWVYVVYLPIFCLQSGLGDKVAGVALSCTNMMLFGTPLIRRIVQRNSVRRVIRFAFAAVGVLMIAATALSGQPWVAVLLLFTASTFLITLDVCGGLPFLMAVKPSERTEMAAVYSSFRDVSGIVTPGVAALVLLVAPVGGLFASCGLGMFGAWALAGTLHPRLGHARAVAPA